MTISHSGQPPPLSPPSHCMCARVLPVRARVLHVFRVCFACACACFACVRACLACLRECCVCFACFRCARKFARVFCMCVRLCFACVCACVCIYSRVLMHSQDLELRVGATATVSSALSNVASCRCVPRVPQQTCAPHNVGAPQQNARSRAAFLLLQLPALHARLQFAHAYSSVTLCSRSQAHEVSFP